jgi:hypothetical protein
MERLLFVEASPCFSQMDRSAIHHHQTSPVAVPKRHPCARLANLLVAPMVHGHARMVIPNRINAAMRISRKIPRVLFVLTAVIHSSSLESIPILFARKDRRVAQKEFGHAVSVMARPFHAEMASLRILKEKSVKMDAAIKKHSSIV